MNKILKHWFAWQGIDITPFDYTKKSSERDSDNRQKFSEKRSEKNKKFVNNTSGNSKKEKFRRKKQFA